MRRGMGAEEADAPPKDEPPCRLRLAGRAEKGGAPLALAMCKLHITLCKAELTLWWGDIVASESETALPWCPCVPCTRHHFPHAAAPPRRAPPARRHGMTEAEEAEVAVAERRIR